MDSQNQSSTPKYRIIFNDLVRAIREGQFKPGSRLPTERELSARYNVHRMTVRQANNALVQAGMAIKRHPLGMFVRKDCGQGQGKQRLNLICPVAESTHAGVFMEYGAKRAREFGYTARVLRVFPGDEHIAAEAILGPDPTIVMGLGCDPRDDLGRAIRQANDRVVVIGLRLENVGLFSITGDDALGVQLAVDHLRQHGHEQIALLCSYANMENPTLQHQIASWKKSMQWSGLNSRELDEYVIQLRSNPECGTGRNAADAVKRHFQAGFKRTTAIIGLSEVVSAGAASALYELGLKIPHDVSLISYAGTETSTLATPPWTSIDVGVERHIDLALTSLTEAATSPEKFSVARQQIHVIRPELKVRKSVGSAPAREILRASRPVAIGAGAGGQA